MSASAALENRRILVIDDNVSIHHDFRKILAPRVENDAMSVARAALFGEAPTLPIRTPFEIDTTDQGQKGLGLVDSALREGRPYAMAFVDMRMPPGWDGLETIEHLWYSQPDLEIVICSAYADHPWDEVSQRIGQNDRLLILMKPFNSIEVIQLAISLTTKWNLRREMRAHMEHLLRCTFESEARLRETNSRAQQTVARHLTSGSPTPGSAGTPMTEHGQAQAEFLTIISHELLAPLNRLTATIGALLATSLDRTQQNHLADIQRSSQEIASMLNDMHLFLSDVPADSLPARSAATAQLQTGREGYRP